LRALGTLVMDGLSPRGGFDGDTPSFGYPFKPLRKPLVSGVIKVKPDDFRVDEMTSISPTGMGEHDLLQIRKTNTNTDWLAGQLAGFCGIRKMDVGYAGRKDRMAVTSQWFSCHLPGRQMDWKSFSLPGVEILSVARHEKKLRKGELEGNRFEIILRHLLPLEGTSMDTLEQRLVETFEDLQQRGFPNYFGEQRFGAGGRNIEGALAYFDAQKAMKKSSGRRRRQFKSGKDIYISAARSWLFNTWLSSALAGGDTGSLQTIDGPLYGDGDDRGIYPEGLAQQLCAGLDDERAKGARRAAMVIPENLTWYFEKTALASPPATELGELHLSFTLPAGCYATVLLREVVAL